VPAAKAGDLYLMYVQWSEEDQLYIGYWPDLFLGGVCHADNRLEAYAKLMDIIEDDLAHRAARGESLPEPVTRSSPSMKV
jgi:hypothetical protein